MALVLSLAKNDWLWVFLNFFFRNFHEDENVTQERTMIIFFQSATHAILNTLLSVVKTELENIVAAED